MENDKQANDENMNGEMTSSKTYKRKMSIFWWASRWAHIKFISRELTSVFVAGYAILFLCFINSVLKGEDSYKNFLNVMNSPLVIALHVLALLGLLFHSITWFNLAPKAMVIKIGNKNIPGVIIVLMNYGGWLVISAALFWFFLNGQ